MTIKPSRFTDEQIIEILREQEAGAATADVWRKHGISSAPYMLVGREKSDLDYFEY